MNYSRETEWLVDGLSIVFLRTIYFSLNNSNNLIITSVAWSLCLRGRCSCSGWWRAWASGPPPLSPPSSASSCSSPPRPGCRAAPGNIYPWESNDISTIFSDLLLTQLLEQVTELRLDATRMIVDKRLLALCNSVLEIVERKLSYMMESSFIIKMSISSWFG